MRNTKRITDLTLNDLKRLIREAVEEAINKPHPGREPGGPSTLEYLKAEFNPERVVSHEDLRRRLSGKGGGNWAQDIVREREERI